ncbi:DUF1522 domain-containing protein, partial [Rhodopseudomonas sp. BAL398]
DGTAGGNTAVAATKTLGGLSGALTGSAVNNNNSTPAAITAATKLNEASGAASNALGATTVADGDSFSVNGKTITFKAGAVPTTAPSGTTLAGNLSVDASGNSTIYIGASSTTSTATVGDVINAIDLASGVAYNNAGTVTANAGQTLSSITAGAVKLQSSTGADLSVSGKADLLKAFGLTTAVGAGTTTVGAARTTSAATVGSLIQDGSTLNVNGKTITFKNGATPTASSSHTGVTGNLETDGSGNSTVYLQSATLADALKAIDLATGVQTATLAAGGATVATSSGNTNSSVNVNGTLKLSTGTASDLTIAGGAGNALSVLGLNGTTGTDTAFTAARSASSGGVNGKTLTFSSFQGGTAVAVTFGDGSNGTVKTLAQLNTALQANNQTATVDA